MSAEQDKYLEVLRASAAGHYGLKDAKVTVLFADPASYTISGTTANGSMFMWQWTPQEPLALPGPRDWPVLPK